MSQDIKKTKNKIWLQFSLFMILMLATLATLIASSFFVNDNLQPGMVISGTYQAIVKYGDVNRSEAITTLQDKINPLRRKTMVINRISGNRLNIIVPRGDYKTNDDFLREIERRGSIFFLDEKGKDLLVGTGEKDKFQPSDDKTAKRIVLKDFIDSESIAPTLISGVNRPGINFKIKNLELYKAINTYQENKPVYIWQDFGQMLDEIRNDYEDLIKFRRFINSKLAGLEGDSAQNLKKSLAGLLKATVINNNSGVAKIVEFDNQNVVTDTDVYNFFKDSKIIYTEVRNFNKDYPNRDLTIDINDEEDTYSNQKFLNPFRPYLNTLIDETFKEQEKYKNKYLITASPLKLQGDMAVIEMIGEEAATSLAKVFSAGVKGISYQVESFAVTNYLENHPEIKNIIYIVLGIVILLTVVILSVFYRVLGFIFSIILVLMVVMAMVAYNMLIGIYGWEILIALIIGIMLALSAGVTLLAKIKSEFISGKSLKQSFLDANRKTISIFFDLAALLVIVSFFIFWFSIGIIKSFSIMLIITNIANILFVLLLTRLIYFSIMSFDFVNRHSKLVISNFSLVKFNYLKTNKFSASISRFFTKKSYQKLFKWIFLATASIITCGIIVASTAGPGTSLEFDRGTILQIETVSGNNSELEKDNSLKDQIIKIQDIIKEYLKVEYGNYYHDVTIFQQIESKDYNIVIKTSLTDNPKINNLQNWLSSNDFKGNITINNVSSGFLINETSRQIIINGVIVIAITIAVIGVYLLLRFDWPSALTMILAIIHELLLVSALLIIVRLEITIEIIVALLAIIIFSFIKKLIVFDYIRENKTIDNNKVDQLKPVVDKGFKLSFRNTIISCFFTVVLGLTLLVFNQNFGSIFILCISSVITTTSTAFLVRTLWIYFAKIKIKRKIHKKEKIYKSITGVDEQIVLGIND